MRGRQTRGSSHAPHRLVGAATRQTALAGTRAHPCDRQSPGPPALVPTPRSAGLSKSQGRFPHDRGRRSKAVPIDGRARERGSMGSPGLGSGGRLRRFAAVRGLGAAPAGCMRTCWVAESGCVSEESGCSEAGNLRVTLPYPFLPSST